VLFAARVGDIDLHLVTQPLPSGRYRLLDLRQAADASEASESLGHERANVLIHDTVTSDLPPETRLQATRRNQQQVVGIAGEVVPGRQIDTSYVTRDYQHNGVTYPQLRVNVETDTQLPAQLQHVADMDEIHQRASAATADRARAGLPPDPNHAPSLDYAAIVDRGTSQVLGARVRYPDGTVRGVPAGDLPKLIASLPKASGPDPGPPLADEQIKMRAVLAAGQPLYRADGSPNANATGPGRVPARFPPEKSKALPAPEVPAHVGRGTGTGTGTGARAGRGRTSAAPKAGPAGPAKSRLRRAPSRARGRGRQREGELEADLADALAAAPRAPSNGQSGLNGRPRWF